MDNFGLTFMYLHLNNLIGLEIINNTVSDKPIFFGLNLFDYTIPENQGQIIIGNSKSVIIQNYKFDEILSPLILFNSTNVLITDNFIENSWVGIQLIEISEGLVTGNELLMVAFDGITLIGSLSIDITRNIIDFQGEENHYSFNLIDSVDILLSWNNIYSYPYSTSSLNKFAFNYWDGWTEPDENYVCIVDRPYPIYLYNAIISYDLTPLTQPIVKNSAENAFCKYKALASTYIDEHQTSTLITTLILVLLVLYQVIRKIKKRKYKPKHQSESYPTETNY